MKGKKRRLTRQEDEARIRANARRETSALTDRQILERIYEKQEVTEYRIDTHEVKIQDHDTIIRGTGIAFTLLTVLAAVFAIVNTVGGST